MAVLDVTRASGAAWYRDERTRAIAYQILALVGFFGLAVYLIGNMVSSMATKGLTFGLDFLGSVAGFDISFSLVHYDPAINTYWDVFVIGLLNTLLVSVLAIVASTVLGFVLGVLRLSHNWLVSRLVYVYIEVLRNIPLLLIILLCAAVFQYLPQLRDAHAFLDLFFLSNRGLVMPDPVAQPGFWLTPAAFVVGLAISRVVKLWARRRQESTGQTFPVGLVSLALTVGLPVLVFLMTGLPVSLEAPVLKGFNFEGGIVLPPPFLAMFLALTVYTAAFIAETVRSGIEAVSHGQTEAAYSLGLRPGRTLRLVVIPQAMRVIVPPLASEQLSLVKNSSLGVAVAYPDMVSVFAGTTLNQTGHAVEILGMTMLFYLACSLSISMGMNWYNRRIALVER